MSIIAVSYKQYEENGCVNCGCDYCYSNGFSGMGSTPVTCGECKATFVVLINGLDKSKIGFGNPAIYPVRQNHPRIGIPKHEYVKEDERPINGGEYWSPRGVGYDLSGFVKSKQAGERIVKIIENIIGKEPKSWLDYRKNEPNWIQVKIQSEDGFNLEKLCMLCQEDKIITEEKLKESLNL